MTEYKMTPPTAMGAIKVGESVTVVVDLVLCAEGQASGLTTLKFE